MNIDDSELITATGLLTRLWTRRYFIVGNALIFAALALIFALLLPEKYTVSILVGPVTPFETPGSSSASGLASSLLLGKQVDPKFTLFQAIIQAEGFAGQLYTKYGYVRQMHSTYGVNSPGEFYRFLGKNLVVTPSINDPSTVEIALELPDRDFARTLLVRIFDEGNQAIRQMDTARAQKFSGYVEDRFTHEPNKSLQDAMLSLLLTQERFLMVTRVDLPYAANLIDGPNVSERPTSPKKVLMVAIGLVVGFILSVAWLLLWDAICLDRKRRGFPPPKFSSAESIRRRWRTLGVGNA